MRYRARLSGPLLDRIDLQLEVARVPYRALSRAQNRIAHESGAQEKGAELSEGAGAESEESSTAIRARVVAARAVQLQRQNKTNNLLHGREIERFCKADAEGGRLLDAAMDKLGLSARAYHRVLKVARTVADLAARKAIHAQDISLAIQLRCFDRITRQ